MNEFPHVDLLSERSEDYRFPDGSPVRQPILVIRPNARSAETQAPRPLMPRTAERTESGLRAMVAELMAENKELRRENARLKAAPALKIPVHTANLKGDVFRPRDYAHAATDAPESETD